MLSDLAMRAKALWGVTRHDAFMELCRAELTVAGRRDRGRRGLGRGGAGADRRPARARRRKTVPEAVRHGAHDLSSERDRVRSGIRPRRSGAARRAAHPFAQFESAHPRRRSECRPLLRTDGDDDRWPVAFGLDLRGACCRIWRRRSRDKRRMLDLFEIAALLLVLSAVFAWINVRFIGLPQTIGLLLMALARLAGADRDRRRLAGVEHPRDLHGRRRADRLLRHADARHARLPALRRRAAGRFRPAEGRALAGRRAGDDRRDHVDGDRRRRHLAASRARWASTCR